MNGKILAVLREHKGYKSAINVENLLNKLRTDDDDINERELRARISDLVKYDRALIGSCNNGFYWITNEDDLRIAVSYLSDCLKPIAERRAALKFNYDITHTPQQDLFTSST